jgi:hypothetical protein
MIKGKHPIFMIKYSEKYNSISNPIPKSYALGLGYFAVYNFASPEVLNDLDLYLFFIRIVHINYSG